MAAGTDGASANASDDERAPASEVPEPFRRFQPRHASVLPVAHGITGKQCESDHPFYTPVVTPAKVSLPPADLGSIASEDLLREILRRVGEDPEREGLRQTPERIVRSWEEIFGGYRMRPEDILVTQFQAERYDEMVLLRDIEFYSTCEHHMLPFHGKAHIAYFPGEKIVGLSKLARLLEIYARRLQVQERLTRQVATELYKVLRPRGVAVMVEAQHACMCCRGVGKQESTMVTSCFLGLFKEDFASRTEFLALVKA